MTDIIWLIPGRVFYVLIGFALAFDSSEVPLTTLLQQGMLTNILTCSVLGNLSGWVLIWH